MGVRAPSKLLVACQEVLEYSRRSDGKLLEVLTQSDGKSHHHSRLSDETASDYRTAILFYLPID
jgi:hypothetical protein